MFQRHSVAGVPVAVAATMRPSTATASGPPSERRACTGVPGCGGSVDVRSAMPPTLRSSTSPSTSASATRTVATMPGRSERYDVRRWITDVPSITSRSTRSGSRELPRSSLGMFSSDGPSAVGSSGSEST